MAPRARPPRPQRGVTVTVVRAPGLTEAERLARHLAALEAMLRPLPPAAPEPGTGNGDTPARRPA
jgi:hypothetical protein